MARALDGWISGYSVELGGLATRAIRLTGTHDTGVNVDRNAPLRFQYPVRIPSNGTAKQTTPRIIGSLKFEVFPGDPEDWHHTRVFGVSMFVVKASVFRKGLVPSSRWLRKQQGVKVYRSDETVPPSRIGEEVTLTVRGPTASQLEPNTKYWVMLMASAWVPGSTPSTRNDWPASGPGPDYTGSRTSRGVSVWTNRTPHAPDIILPVSGSTFDANTNVTLLFQSRDPDRFSGKDDRNYGDVAGVQVQYAPRATPTNTDPKWRDMPFAETQKWVEAHGGQRLGRGWYLHRSSRHRGSGGAEIDTGIKGLWSDFTAEIRVGSRSISNGRGVLPAGDWQIRMRTFDYGHPFPNDAPPFGAPMGPGGADITPYTAPAMNTSPWSKVTTITVIAQVPPPLPLAPADYEAVMVDQEVEFSWQYRNTAKPPFPQASYRVQVRKVGDDDWTTVASASSALAKFVMPEGAFNLVSGNLYEWRVSATDTDGYESEWSDPEHFWAVPYYNSGELRPTADETTSEVLLGSGTHRAFIYRRGGKVLIGEVKGLTAVDWGRTRDETSTAQVVCQDWDVDCGNLLAVLEPWAYELHLHRTIETEDGKRTDPVWEGPLTLITYEVDKVTIDAKDVTAYLYRRAVRQKMNDRGLTVTDRAMRVIQNCMAPDDPNILAYLRPLFRDDDAKQYRSLPPYSRTGYEEVDDMAANAGLDYTAIGRSILLWGTRHRIGTLPEFKDKNFGSPPIVSVYGMSTANRYIISDGNGIYGVAERLDENGRDEKFGLIELLSSTWASEADDEDGIYTAEGIEKMRKTFAEQAERSIADRYPPPLIVRVPDNTSLAADTAISIQDLVPGVVIPLRSTKTLREVAVTQKLDAIRVSETGGVETVSITMGAFTRDDAAMGEVTEG